MDNFDDLIIEVVSAAKDLQASYEWCDGVANAERDLTKATRSLRAEIARVTAERDALAEANRWIPVGERYPDTDAVFPWSTVNVMILCGDEVISPVYYNLDNSAFFKRGQWIFRSQIIGGTVTHWRPLPALPVEVE